MSKAGLDAMTKSLAVEWGPKGIRFNAIAPGIIPTQGASSRLRPKVKGNEQLADQRAQQNPTRRLGTLEDLGNLAAYILAPDNTWLNGQTITLDGGDALANGAYFKEYLDWDGESEDVQFMTSITRSPFSHQRQQADTRINKHRRHST
jgi:hypothetical protein